MPHFVVFSAHSLTKIGDDEVQFRNKLYKLSIPRDDRNGLRGYISLSQIFESKECIATHSSKKSAGQLRIDNCFQNLISFSRETGLLRHRLPSSSGSMPTFLPWKAIPWTIALG